MSVFADLMTDLSSHAMRLGLFETVQTHEPKNSPGTGMHCTVFLSTVEPVRSSGLDSTSVRLGFTVRIVIDMLQEPQDDIDKNLLDAVYTLLGEYHTDLNFLGDARSIDVLGSDGDGLRAVAGYWEIDSKMYRFAEITVPIIVNDVWNQEVQ